MPLAVVAMGLVGERAGRARRAGRERQVDRLQHRAALLDAAVVDRGHRDGVEAGLCVGVAGAAGAAPAGLGRTVAELAVGWLLANPRVTAVLVGAERPEEVQQNLRVVARPLEADELVAIEAAT